MDKFNLVKLENYKTLSDSSKDKVMLYFKPKLTIVIELLISLIMIAISRVFMSDWDFTAGSFILKFILYIGVTFIFSTCLILTNIGGLKKSYIFSSLNNNASQDLADLVKSNEDKKDSLYMYGSANYLVLTYDTVGIDDKSTLLNKISDYQLLANKGANYISNASMVNDFTTLIFTLVYFLPFRLLQTSGMWFTLITFFAFSGALSLYLHEKGWLKTSRAIELFNNLIDNELKDAQ